MKTIVLIWKIASWKDYAWEYLAKKLRAKCVWISSSLRIVAKERGTEDTRENLIAIGKELAEKFGDGYLAEVLYKKFISEDILIITWPRQLGQLEYLRKNTQTTFIAIEASPEIRYKRMKQRQKIGENISFEKFIQLEQLDEWEVQNVSKCMELADITIENNGSLEEFEEKLEKIAASFSS